MSGHAPGGRRASVSTVVVAPEIAARIQQLTVAGASPVDIAHRLRLTLLEVRAVLSNLPIPPMEPAPAPDHWAAGQARRPLPDVARGRGSGPGRWWLGWPHQWWVLAHDAHRPLVTARTLGIGVVAACLAELAAAGWVQVERSRGYWVHPLIAPVAVEGPGATAHLVWRWLGSEPEPRPVAEWLVALHQVVARRVERDLLGAGFLRHRSLLRGGGAEPVDVSAAGWPAARLGGLLTRGDQLRDRDVALVAVAHATGVATTLWHDDPAQATAVDAVIAALPHTHPSLAIVTAVTGAVVESHAIRR